MSNEKHFYLGANTPDGFFSYYDSIVSQQEARKIYCIKGGPGTGKSSFMRKIAEKILSLGYDVEFIHCSSDDDSLDGIFVKRLKIAFLDGTAPHIVDPKNPGAVDKIINLGEFWDEEKMTGEKRGIIDTNREIGETFSRAYKYLAAAKAFYDDINVINEKSYDRYERNLYVEKIIKDEFSHLCICPVVGNERKLFASAITPSGLKFRPQTLFDGYRVKILKGFTGNVFNEISDAATKRGMDTEKFYCVMEPSKKCEHLLIPHLKLAFCTDNEFHNYSDGEIYEFSKKSLYQDELEYDMQMYKNLISKAVETLSGAKKLHDDLEKFYIPNMNFKKIMSLCEKTIKQILEMV